MADNYLNMKREWKKNNPVTDRNNLHSKPLYNFLPTKYVVILSVFFLDKDSIYYQKF